MRLRWLGATGLRVPEIAVEGEDLDVVGDSRIRLRDREVTALVLGDARDVARLEDAHRRGLPVVVRAPDPESVLEALARPEVACALVPPERGELRELDLRRLTYG